MSLITEPAVENATWDEVIPVPELRLYTEKVSAESKAAVSVLSQFPQDAITCAAVEYLLRKARIAHPRMTTKRSNKRYPTQAEEQPCCNSIRAPSAQWPSSLADHCRSAQHVAYRYGISEAALRERAAAVTKAYKPKPGDHAYKIVKLCADGSWQSFWDETKYAIGVTVQGTAKVNHGGGYYVFRTEEDAIRHYDRWSAYDRVLLKVLVGPGPVVMDGAFNGKIAVSALTPVEELGREYVTK